MRRFLLLFLLASVPVGATEFSLQRPLIYQTFSSQALREFNNALTQASRFGSPRYATAALPTCDAANIGAIAYDTTTLEMKSCSGSAWVAAAGGGGAAEFSSVTSPDFIIDDSSGANTFSLAGGNHTANRVMTYIAGTDSSMTLDSGRLTFGQALKVGPVGEAWTTEAGSIAVELVAKNTAADVEIHAEGGLTTGYAGFGVRNNELTDGSGLTLAGGSWLAHGATSASTTYGRSNAGLVTFQNFGANSAGLAIGTATQDPLVLGVTTPLGSEARYWFEDTCFTLTDNTLGAFARIDIPVGSLTSVRVDFLIFALTGAAAQTRAGTAWFTAVNRAGTETCTVGNTAGVDLISITAVESGTIGASFSCATTPTNGINLEITSDSSLTTPAMGICYSIYKSAGLGAINPL